MVFKDYVVFYTKGDRELGNFLTKRAEQLGYKGHSVDMCHISVTLDTKYGGILWTTEGSSPNDTHELGNFQDFLTTDKYRFVPPKPKIKVGDYEVEFRTDYMKVGCLHITYGKVEEIIKAYREHEASIPF